MNFDVRLFFFFFLIFLPEAGNSMSEFDMDNSLSLSTMTGPTGSFIRSGNSLAEQEGATPSIPATIIKQTESIHYGSFYLRLGVVGKSRFLQRVDV